MMRILVGSTGFVGANLMAGEKFDGVYHSTDVAKAYGTRPDILYYAGIRGTKFLANQNSQEDWEHIQNTIENIKKINPQKLVLVSTVDVYEELKDRDEDDISKLCHLNSYGKNRLKLENWVEREIEDYHILRLPAIYGRQIKKNFIYDMIHFVPPYLEEYRWRQLRQQYREIADCYQLYCPGLYKITSLEENIYRKVRNFYKKEKWNALSFTDSRAEYQFFNLGLLNQCVRTVIKHKIKKINLVTEPVRADEVYEYVYKGKFINYIDDNPVMYRLKTKYGRLFGTDSQYIMSRQDVLENLNEFIGNAIRKYE